MKSEQNSLKPHEENITLEESDGAVSSIFAFSLFNKISHQSKTLKYDGRLVYFYSYPSICLCLPAHAHVFLYAINPVKNSVMIFAYVHYKLEAKLHIQ